MIKAAQMTATMKPGRTATTPASAQQPHADAVSVLGVKVHAVTRESTGVILESLARAAGSHIVVPVNPEMIIASRSNAPFRSVLNGAALVLPDGTGVKLALRLAGVGEVERVTGVDTVDQLAGIACHAGLKLFLLGAAPGVAEETARRLQARHAGLAVAGTYAGSPRELEEADICGRVNASGAEILLVAFGAPKQELWLARNLWRLNVKIAVCVGGSFDFIAGVATRAPLWMQKSGLEWLYRLLQEPRRWRRMLALPKFALLVLLSRVNPFSDMKE